MDKALLDKQTSFLSLDLDDRLLRALGSMGIVHPTLVQAKAIPLALAGKDVLARAKTGSGKTAAYCLPVLHKILNIKETLPINGEERRQTRALVLVPTRELAEQVTKYFEDLSRFCGKEITTVNIAKPTQLHIQASSLLAEHPDIVVSTPAGIMKHVAARTIDLSQSLETLVIDEADLVLSFGYEDDIKGVAPHLPKIHQTMLFSATLNNGIEALKKLLLSKPAILTLEDDKEEQSSLVQYVVRCTEEEKFLLSYVILKLRLIAGKCILFVNDIDRSYRLKLFLEKFSIRACVLNSELPLNSRYHIVEEFNRGVYDYIIATDESDKMGEADGKGEEESDADEKDGDNAMDTETKDEKESVAGETDEAKSNSGKTSSKKDKKGKDGSKKRKRGHDKEYGVARGIDFKNVAAVINFDFPLSARAYTHRVGRTARAGRRGMSLSFVTREDAQSKSTEYKKEEAVFERVAVQQRKKGSEIQPYKFDMKQVEGFRYRSSDALGLISRIAIREARIKEIKQEILNSEKLKAHFEDKPKDLHFLRHDKALRPDQVKPHMKHIPQYMVPKIAGIAQADGIATTPNVGFVPFNKTEKRQKFNKRSRKNGDPLKSFGRRRK